MSIPSNSVLNSGDKESKSQKITRPLRAVLGGRKVTANGSDKKLYSTLGRVGMGAILFTIGLPYTIVAGGILARKAFKKETQKPDQPMPKISVEIPKKESKVEGQSHISDESNTSEESSEIKSKKNEASFESQSSVELSSEHSSSSEDFNPLSFFNVHLLKTPEEKQEQAKKILEMADQGDVLAQYMAGVARDYYNIGIHLKLNDSDSMNYLNKAADQGYPSAQLVLGKYYLTGKYVPQDSAKAVEYFMRCIEDSKDLAYPEGCYQLGKCYQAGEGIDKNDAFAHTYFQNAAEKDHADAQYETAMYYKTGKGFTNNKRDLSEAFKFFQLASDQSHSNALIELGHCYRAGRGTPKDVKKAFEIYQEAAAESGAGKVELAQCYRNGIGTVKNDIEALRLFSEAVDEGITQANYFIAELYLNRQGTIDNNAEPLHKALEFFKANTDNQTAKNMLYNIYDQGIPGIIKQDQDLAKTFR